MNESSYWNIQSKLVNVLCVAHGFVGLTLLLSLLLLFIPGQ